MIKKLLVKLVKKSGRNNTGKIMISGQGSGVKRNLRILDKFRNNNKLAIVKRIEKDPNRSALIALIYYETGLLSYILAPENLKLNQKINQGIELASSLKIKLIPIGTEVHNLEIYPNKGAQIARAAGTKAIILKRENFELIKIKLKSGEIRLVNHKAKAVIGQVSNQANKMKNLFKAGQSRLLNKRPKVRGIAKNPVDHPNGGRTNKKKHSKSPWGKINKGIKTRKSKKLTSKLIIKPVKIIIKKSKKKIREND